MDSDDITKIILAFIAVIFIALVAYSFITSNIDIWLKVVIGIFAAAFDIGILYRTFSNSG
ncbi:MAG: hypothetical protein WCA51_03030 [Dehalococcoidia bacterium]